jgi:hypothetical protein
MNIYIIIGVVVAILISTGVYIYKNKTMNDKNSEKNNIKIELINPIDKRVLTKQGIDIITKAINDEDYGIEVVNTSYTDKKDRIEKSIHLRVNTADNRYSYIIPSEMLYWEEGQAYKYNPTKEIKGKWDIIKFNNFKLSDFLNEDPNFIKDSRMLNMFENQSGYEVPHIISISPNPVKAGEKVKIIGTGFSKHNMIEMNRKDGNFLEFPRGSGNSEDGTMLEFEIPSYSLNPLPIPPPGVVYQNLPPQSEPTAGLYKVTISNLASNKSSDPVEINIVSSDDGFKLDK